MHTHMYSRTIISVPVTDSLATCRAELSCRQRWCLCHHPATCRTGQPEGSALSPGSRPRESFHSPSSQTSSAPPGPDKMSQGLGTHKDTKHIYSQVLETFGEALFHRTIRSVTGPCSTEHFWLVDCLLAALPTSTYTTWTVMCKMTYWTNLHSFSLCVEATLLKINNKMNKISVFCAYEPTRKGKRKFDRSGNKFL